MFEFYDSAGFTWGDGDAIHQFGDALFMATLGEISSTSIENVTKKLDISAINGLSNQLIISRTY